MFRTTQKTLAIGCGTTTARRLLTSPCSPLAPSAQVRSFVNSRPASDIPNNAPPHSSRYYASMDDVNHNISVGSPTTVSDINNFNDHSLGDRLSYFSNSSSSRAPTPQALSTTENNAGANNGLSPRDYREAAEKVWGTLYATPERLENSVTGSAGSARITHNLNHGNARWQASCVEVRQKAKKDDNENPVLARRKKQFGGLMPWEKAETEKKSKFPKSDKFPADDDVEIVFYFETHDAEGVGLKGYQNIAERVSDGDLPGECSNLSAVGGFATWTVPRSEFVALTESKPLLGESLLMHAPQRGGHAESERKNAANIGEALRRITIRMSNAEDQKKHFANATVL